MANLGSLVAEQHVVVGSMACTADDVITELAGRLAASGHVDAGYGAACIVRERRDPTGLPTGGAAVAIPHGDPSLVNRAAVAIAVPVQPVPFASMGDPDERLDAAVIFLLALREAEDQLAMLRQIAELIQDPGRLAALADARDTATLLALVGSSNGTEVQA